MAGYDGSVRIKAELNHSNFDKGVSGMSSTLKRFAGAVGAAFSVAAIINFGKQSIAAASDLSNAWQGLQSIVEGQGKSFSKAQSFINDYIKDGLVPLENAVTAYKNLAARGYDDEQIEQTLTALKDAAAFGRQSSYTLGEAVTTATEGLKNENSILVDNAGVTKNVAKMWDEYAKSIGTTAQNLTQEQKIQAEVNGILQETRFQTGDAAKVAGTYSGQVSSLSYNFQNLKVAVGQGLIPIAQAVLPGINAIISGLTTLANVFAKVSSLLFGKGSGLSAQASTQKQIASTGSAAADATNELADATKGAGGAAKQAEKDLKGVLAGFDELNILATDTAESVGGAGGSLAGGAGAADVELPESVEKGTLFEDVEISPKILEFVEKLKAAVEPIGETLGAGMRWFYDNVLVPLGQWTVNEALPAFLDLLGGLLDALNETILALQPAALWLWNEFLQPLAEWTGDKFIDALKQITDLLHDFADLISGELSFGDFIGQLTPFQNALISLGITLGAFSLADKIGKAIFAFETLGKTIGSIGIFGKLDTLFATASSDVYSFSDAMLMTFGPASIFAGIAAVVGGIALAFTNFFSMLQNGFSWVKEILMVVGIALAAVGAIILGAPALVTAVIAAIVAAVATAVVLIKEHWEEIKAFFVESWEKIKETCSAAWESIKGKFSQGAAELKQDWQNVKAFFSDFWNGIVANAQLAWANIKNVWYALPVWFQSNVIDPIRNGFRNFINGLIGFAEGFANRFISGINAIISAFNNIRFSVPDWVPVIGGSYFGFNLGYLSGVSLPRLANGAVIPPNQQFAAILGDQRSGTNIEAPLATIEQALQNVFDRNGGLPREINITVESVLDGKVIARNTVKHVNDMTIAAGRSVLLV